MALVMNNEFSVKGLAEALDEYMQAKHKHDKARDAYDGYSWGYAGRDEINRMDAALDAFNVKLDEFIENKVNSVLESRQRTPRTY